MTEWVEALGRMAFPGVVVALFVATVNDVRAQLAAQESVSAAGSNPQEDGAPVFVREVLL